MKKIVLAIAVAVLCSASSVVAQKFGYVNSQELLASMPEAKKADSSLQLFAKSYQDQIESMIKEYQKKGQEYQAQEKTMTEAVKEVKMRDLQKLEENIQQTQQSAQDKVAKKKEDLFTPILEKADKAIKEVAKANNYDYVFDASAGALLYAKDSDNILPLVKTKLGIK
ncbi:MAG TPA: OmpH family outer membrane protein [Flavipsychrobacter sp.]|jgi:outer membrane protein|nr:OmpH family outer membrane protein [Flavipsychrobacter sp.]